MQTTDQEIIKLSTIDDSVLVMDLNHQFHYKRFVKPDEVASNCFVLSYKGANQTTWNVSKSLLSNEYTVAKTEQVIDQIKTSLNSEVINPKHYRSNTSVKSSFSLQGIDLNVTGVDEADAILFRLFTNIDPDLNNVISSKLTFNIINGYSGNHALSLNYGVSKKFTYSGQSVEVNNIFILDSFTKRLVHDNHLTTITFEELTNVQSQIVTKINLFKALRIGLSFEEGLNAFPKKFVKRFNAYYDMLPEQYRTLYYITFILSMLLEVEKRVVLEIQLREFIRKYIVQIAPRP